MGVTMVGVLMRYVISEFFNLRMANKTIGSQNWCSQAKRSSCELIVPKREKKTHMLIKCLDPSDWNQSTTFDRWNHIFFFYQLDQ